jgi:putative transposase
MDSGYRGTFVTWVKEHLGWSVEVVQHPWTGLKGVWTPQGVEVEPELIKPKGFQVLPRRWALERTFGWLNTARRLFKDYEYWPASSEAWIYLAMLRLMVKRLARAKAKCPCTQPFTCQSMLPIICQSQSL